jgi:hypothetical protein
VTSREQRAEHITDVWFLTSEIEGQRAGSFRQERWAKVFLGGGARVSFFNVQGAFGARELHFEDEAQFTAFRREVARTTKPVASVREGAWVRFLRRGKHLFLVDLYLPNVLMLFFKTRKRLLGSGRVLVMASSPPFAVALVGALLKWLRAEQVVLAVDMRDAWGLHPVLGGSRWLKQWIERRVMRVADAISTVSHGLKDEYEAAYGVPVRVLYNVATHYFDVGGAQPIDWRALNPRIDPGRYKLVYTGSTPEGFYDVRSLVSGVKRLRSASPVLADRLQLVFVGACREVAAEVERQKLVGDDIVFVDLVPHETAKAIQKNADALIFLAYDGDGNRGVVSTKFFEYLALGKHILPVSVRKDSDVDRLLRKYAGRTCNLQSDTAIADVLKHVAEGGGDAFLPKVDDPRAVRPLLEAYEDFAQVLLEGDAACAESRVSDG